MMIASDRRRALKTQADYDALFEEYERESLPRQGRALKAIEDWIGSGERVALTCYERGPHRCHRHSESFYVVDPQEMVPIGSIDTRDNWRERRELLLGRVRVYDKLEEVIGAANENAISLALFKPTRILDLKVEGDEREWDPRKLSEMRRFTGQQDLFDENSWRDTFRLIPKLPYKFSYRFEDVTGKQSEQQILDWEIGALYWNCFRRAEGDERIAIAKVRQKYLDEFRKTDLHLYLGTTQRWHGVGPNPWLIIGVLPIPAEPQLGLF